MEELGDIPVENICFVKIKPEFCCQMDRNSGFFLFCRKGTAALADAGCFYKVKMFWIK